MKKNFIIDYLSYITLRFFGPLVRIMPLHFNLFLGKVLGDLLYCLDLKHKSLAYANIKLALGKELSPAKTSWITKKFYHNLGLSLIEILLIPKVNQDYLSKYIKIEGKENIEVAFKRGRGVILLGVHEGSWEFSNILCANLGFPFSLLVREQRLPRLDKLLNLYRQEKGCKLIQRKNQTRQLIEALKNNEAVGMTADQGGKTGELVKFFGRDASMPTGAIRLGLKYDATILPGFYIRLNGPYHKVVVGPVFELKNSGNPDVDIIQNLQAVVSIFENLISRYPQEYLWPYKIWKYAKERNILILSDGKAGHIRQAEAVANIVVSLLLEKSIRANIVTIEVQFKNKISSRLLTLSSGLAGKYHCQGCLWCLRRFLKIDSYKRLAGVKPDIIVSSGASLAPVNFIISRENLAKSIVVMRPGILSTRRFNLVIMPEHDQPPKRKNVVVTEGALNLIDEDYLKEQSQELIQATGYRLQATGLYTALLIGGNTKGFFMTKDMVVEVIREVKSVAEKMNLDILVTTSRRTSPEIENLLKQEFNDYLPCRLLIIANEKNLPFALGGILGLSQIVIVSPESISMISEAVSSKKQVIVFNATGLDKKHRQFLNYFAKNGYIHLVEPKNLSQAIEYIKVNNPQIHILNDRFLISEAIKKIL